MSLYALSDLHLSLADPKPMEKFGPAWADQVGRLTRHWQETVSEEDMVLLPGDLSWAMGLSGARPDLALLEGLPGRKVLMEGNHDYWWETKAKLTAAFPGLNFLKNDFVDYDGVWAVCGTRGWVCPGGAVFTAQDEKIYRREDIRLRLSLDAAIRAGYEKLVVMFHFPPMNEKKEPSLFTQTLAEYPQVKKVVYGHLHGPAAHRAGPKGERDGVEYYLVSADYLAFCPVRVLP